MGGGRKMIVAGGGTGGHLFPGIAIAEEFLGRDPANRVLFVGTERGLEKRVLSQMGYTLETLDVEGVKGRGLAQKFGALAKIPRSLAQSRRILRQFGPDIVIGVGGYVSLPLLWAAQRFGTPTVLHEQNKRLGMANRMLADKANRIYLGFPDTLGEYPRERARVVGNPVRAGFLDPPGRAEARQRLELDPDCPVILITGGSQGAGSINRAVNEALPAFAADEAQFLWMTGADGAAAARECAAAVAASVRVFHFIEDMPTACAAADVIVGRAGASTTAEIAVLGKPSILIPYPHATDNHQEENARAFADAGAAVLILDSECSGNRLAEAIRGLLADPDARARMAGAARALAHPNAAEALVDDLFDLIFGPEPAAEL